MSEDLQNLLEKINRDGVAKAQAEADRILADAKAKADALVKDARAEAEKAKAAAEQSAKDYEERAKESLRQAARDTLLKVEASVTALLERLLTKDVDRSLGDEKTVAALVDEAVRGVAGAAEVALPAKLVPALRARLAAQRNLTVVTDPALETGFTVRIDGGRIEHAFTGEAVAAEMARRLRPDLAALLK